jgi:threonine dehydrogenase-like Zn-dependent dehydrogenase
MYQGRTAAEPGLVFGHENMGVITEVGSGVTLLKKGDRVVLPFNVGRVLRKIQNLMLTVVYTGCRMSMLLEPIHQVLSTLL